MKANMNFHPFKLNGKNAEMTTDGKKLNTSTWPTTMEPIKPIWPSGCLHPNSCSRHGVCGYVGCVHEGLNVANLWQPIPLTTISGLRRYEVGKQNADARGEYMQKARNAAGAVWRHRSLAAAQRLADRLNKDEAEGF